VAKSTFHENSGWVSVRGARSHNLKNLSVSFPRDGLIVFTGPSGSGKSSLAFDTIYAEGQRRYVESLSAYARQFLEQLGKPDVDSIDGLSPTISIEQKTISYNPRSTVGTTTEIYDYFRLLYARLAKPFCWKCGSQIRSQTSTQIVDQLLELEDQTRLSILAPIVRGRKGEYQKELLLLRQKGFVRVRIDGEMRDLSEDIRLDKNKKHDIEVYVDRLVVKGDRSQLATRMSESVELALKMGEGNLIAESALGSDSREYLMSEKFACIECGISYPPPEPRTFSFNSPMGACKHCDGVGIEPIEEDQTLEEDVDEEVQLFSSHRTKRTPCKKCLGARLSIEALHFKLKDKNISEVSSLPIRRLLTWIDDLEFTPRELKIASGLMKEIRERLHFLKDVGVGYLSLDRSAQTLSGGESQRIRLAHQIGSALVGVIYVLDEPSIGLHQKDNEKLLSTLCELRDLGNTIVVVEHDQETMERADWILDMGPGAGTHGGTVVASGTYEEIKKHSDSLTGKYLRNEYAIGVPSVRRPWSRDRMIQIEGARKNNLKNVDLSLPLGTFICVTGLSGSGKSTLILDTLYPALLKNLFKIDVGDLEIDRVSGLQHIDKVVDIDQSPIGRTPRSNPATYTGLFSPIRDLFASLPEAKIRGFGPGRFSFNVKGGRCEACEGDGMKKIEMHFLPDVLVKCDICGGSRYSRDTLEIRYKGKSISDVLQMTAEDAYPFFEAVPSITSKLKVLTQVGLGYLTLGQSATTLSGGEAQRIKLTKELSRRSTGRTLYILDEPTTGLHFDDIKKLIQILQTLVDQGNTVIVIEHNLDLIKSADHVIDLGPEGGEEGGRIIAQGTPEEVARVASSPTGFYLKKVLEGV
jgi:excinuclease ABC subunit A